MKGVLALRRYALGVLIGFCLGSANFAGAETDFVEFESGPVRPVALSPDGSKLFVANVPDATLEIFDVTPAGLQYQSSVPVGLEPVAVAARNDDEVWVVNHLSDSVSVVDVSAATPYVKRTLLVGDEPRDIVFAGTVGRRAFITTAHRGQQRTNSTISGVTGAGDPQLTTPSVPRNDVWIFDVNNLGHPLGGTPFRIVSFFSDTPRGLAVSPDQSTVYVAAYFSHNQTTVISETVVPDGFQQNSPSGGAPGGVPGPPDNADGVPAPEAGVIVKFDRASSMWKDSIGRDWSALVKHDQPDLDVFQIAADLPATGAVPVVSYAHVGTLLYNVAVNPVTGKVYVTNTDSLNEIRFEGPGDYAGSTTQGQFVRSQITVIDPVLNTVTPKHLNGHIDYSQLHTDPGADHAAIEQQIQHSLATPLDIVVSSDGATIYMAAQGSNKVGVFSASAIEDSNFATNFDPTVASAAYLQTGRGPSGLVLDETLGRLYVLARFDNSVEVIDIASGAKLQAIPIHNPEPTSVIEGRIFQYDATLTSGNGEATCNACHPFMGADQLAWDLGAPDEHVTINPQPNAVPVLPAEPTFHPMKGPMTTQVLKGTSTHGAMHWRGDRADGHFGLDPCNEPTGAACNEDLSFRNFIVAFPGLVGHDGLISSTDMQKFADFALQVFLPPNPVRALDNTLNSLQQAGRRLFLASEGAPLSDFVATCDGCHKLSPIDGFFGAGGERTFEGEPQDMKVAHMRNMYEKIGCFGDSLSNSHMGDQVRGNCFLHDGSLQSLKRFYEASVFNMTAAQERRLEQFSLAFPTDLAPAVGQQVTLTGVASAEVNARFDLLDAASKRPFESLMLGGAVVECDLIAKGRVGGEARGWLRQSGTVFLDDQGNTLSEAALRALPATEGPITFTCVPPGSGVRMALNRDRDGFLNGQDNCPSVANDSQADIDGNGIGDACESGIVDADEDGVSDAIDNCPAVANPAQQDFDQDGAGDACDYDDDDDGVLDAFETGTGVFVSNGDTGSNSLNPDSDGDGVNDGIEVSAGTDPNDPLDVPPSVPLLPAGPIPIVLSIVLATIAAMRRRETR